MKILHLPDLHVGSLWAPMSKEIVIPDVLGEGFMFVEPTALQQYLYDSYINIVTKNKWDAVFVNGDVIDGPNKGGQGRHCWTADVNVQIEAAKQMLSKIDTTKFIFTCGTPYHSTEDRPAENDLAHHFAMEFKEKNDTRYMSAYGYDFLLDISGWKVHVAHCLDYKGNRFDALSRELGTRGADVVLRGHRHECAVISNGRKYGAIGPCWQWRNEFGLVNGMYNGTDIGAQEIDITEDEVIIKNHLVDMSRFNVPFELDDPSPSAMLYTIDGGCKPLF